MPILPPWVTSPIRRLAQSFIESGVRRGYSGAEIIRALREAGLSYRRQEMYRDIRWWRDIVERGSGMKYIRRDITIPEHWYLETPADWGAKYVTRYRVELFNYETGKTEERAVWLKHDEPLSREELEDILYERFIPGYEPQWGEAPYEIRSVTPLYGLKSTSY